MPMIKSGTLCDLTRARFAQFRRYRECTIKSLEKFATDFLRESKRKRGTRGKVQEWWTPVHKALGQCDWIKKSQLAEMGNLACHYRTECQRRSYG